MKSDNLISDDGKVLNKQFLKKLWNLQKTKGKVDLC